MNQAARIGALAHGGEILVSAKSIEGPQAPLGFGVSEPREVKLKGISEPVHVIAVDWR